MQTISHSLYEIPRVFIQGDRDPAGDAKIAALKLGEFLKNKNWGALVGAYGGFVKVMEESGISCVCHETDIKDHGSVKYVNSPSINFSEVGDAVAWLLGEGPFLQAKKSISWGNRLGVWMGTASSYCFFAGNEGTMAHLIPVLAFNAKSWSKSKARPVALIGWDITKITALMQLMGLTKDTLWFSHFELNEIALAVEFLTT